MYIFDIDGTIADMTHRLHFIKEEPKRYKEFFEACVDDKPIRDVIHIMRLLDESHNIVLISGRSDEVREQTKQWLYAHTVPYDLLCMRHQGDHRPAAIVKSELLDELLRSTLLDQVDGVFDDHDAAVAMYRTRGLRVYQVANGNF